jgi:hypothetical protein
METIERAAYYRQGRGEEFRFDGWVNSLGVLLFTLVRELTKGGLLNIRHALSCTPSKEMPLDGHLQRPAG